jgi:hypothetical protein
MADWELREGIAVDGGKWRRLASLAQMRDLVE